MTGVGFGVADFFVCGIVGDFTMCKIKKTGSQPKMSQNKPGKEKQNKKPSKMTEQSQLFCKPMIDNAKCDHPQPWKDWGTRCAPAYYFKGFSHKGNRQDHRDPALQEKKIR
jgi:hypothetical protein